MRIGKQFTNRESQSIDKYLQEIGKVELLDPAEEVELAKKIKHGNEKESQKAMEKLIKANLRFVVSVAKQYQNQGMSLGDLINEGNLGLIKASKRFDETRGFKFISYAVWSIRQSILQALAEQSRIVRLPLNRVSALNKIGKAYSDLEQKNERRPSVDELAEQLDRSLFEVSDTLKISGRHLSIDAPISTGEESKLGDIMPNEIEPLPDYNLNRESLKIDIDRALGELEEREREILKLYYGFDKENPLTLEERAEDEHRWNAGETSGHTHRRGSLLLSLPHHGGKYEFDPWTPQEREILRRFLTHGGFLFAEDTVGAKGYGFDWAFRREMGQVLPAHEMKKLPPDHSVYQSFYLIGSIGGRQRVNPYLEGITLDQWTPVIYSQNDLTGAWSKDKFGKWVHECTPGGELQRSAAFKMGINIIVYSLTSDYKKDVIHHPFIKRRQSL